MKGKGAIIPEDSERWGLWKWPMNSKEIVSALFEFFNTQEGMVSKSSITNICSFTKRS